MDIVVGAEVAMDEEDMTTTALLCEDEAAMDLRLAEVDMDLAVEEEVMDLHHPEVRTLVA